MMFQKPVLSINSSSYPFIYSIKKLIQILAYLNACFETTFLHNIAMINDSIGAYP